jgi:F-type H+-transporting ATPase subunit a
MGRVAIAMAVLLTGAVFPAAAGQATATEAQGKARPEPAEGQPSPLKHVIDETEAWELFPSLEGVKLFGFIPLDRIPLPHWSGVVFGRPVTLRLTKFMILELLAAILIAATFIPVARRLRSGEPARGGLLNAFEVVLTFVRDQIARPTLGPREADRYAPFLWTLFLFILVNNLLGLVPICRSPTGNIFVTLGLAFCAFVVIPGSAIREKGLRLYLAESWPRFDVPYGLGYVLKPFMFVNNVVGLVVQSAVLALRLFANMFAGHTVLATVLIFIYLAGSQGPALWGTVTLASVLGQVALSLLELFIAFLQAYVFTFLTSLFMGMALHPAH